MPRLLRSPCAPLVVLFACAVTLSGCGGATREDRTISFSATGDSVGFQHGGEEGVAGADGERAGGDMPSGRGGAVTPSPPPRGPRTARRLTPPPARARAAPPPPPPPRGRGEAPAGGVSRKKRPVSPGGWRDEPK